MFLVLPGLPMLCHLLPEHILRATMDHSDDDAAVLLEAWRLHYHTCLTTLSTDEAAQVGHCLRKSNPALVLLRPEIEAVWEPIVAADNWQPFYELLAKIQNPFNKA
jgi:uncharacterized protein YdiU (UPF0061 family)